MYWGPCRPNNTYFWIRITSVLKYQPPNIICNKNEKKRILKIPPPLIRCRHPFVKLGLWLVPPTDLICQKFSPEKSFHHVGFGFRNKNKNIWTLISLLLILKLSSNHFKSYLTFKIWKKLAKLWNGVIRSEIYFCCSVFSSRPVESSNWSKCSSTQNLPKLSIYQSGFIIIRISRTVVHILWSLLRWL